MRDSYLQDYYTFLRFPSISTDDAYSEKLAECAHWLVEKLNGIGLEAQLVSTPGHPVVWAKNKHQPGRRTVMLYGHYDVQPPDPLELWDSPPFTPVLKNGHVYARGATDNKGQILAHILGIQETLEEGITDPAKAGPAKASGKGLRDVRLALSNSLGFGGSNSCLAFRHPADTDTLVGARR